MKNRLFLGIASTLLLSITAYSQADDAQTPLAEEQLESALKLTPVPPILRLHLPILGERLGLLVEDVAAGSEPEKAGIRAGDVLIEAGGKPVMPSNVAGPIDTSFPIVVLRRGQTRVLDHRFANNRFLDSMFDPQNPQMQPGSFSTSSSAISIASNTASGARSVSVSRAGDQISLEIRMPELSGQTLRMRGTLPEIEGQLQRQSLSPPVKREIQNALRRAR